MMFAQFNFIPKMVYKFHYFINASSGQEISLFSFI